MSESSIIIELEFRDKVALKRIKKELSKIIKSGEIIEAQSELEAQLFQFTYLEEVMVKGSKLYLYTMNQDLDYLETFITTSFSELFSEISFLCVEDEAHFIVSNINGEAVTLYSIGEDSQLDDKLDWDYQSFTVVKDYYNKTIDKVSAIFWSKFYEHGNPLFKLLCKSKKDALYLRDSIAELHKLYEPGIYKNFISEMLYHQYLMLTLNKKSDYGYELFLQNSENQERIESLLGSIPYDVFKNLKFLVLSDRTVYFGSYLNYEEDLESLFELFWGFVPSPKLRIPIDKQVYNDTDLFYIVAAGSPTFFQTDEFEGVYNLWPTSR